MKCINCVHTITDDCDYGTQFKDTGERINCEQYQPLVMAFEYNQYLLTTTRHNNHRVKIEEPKLMEVDSYEMR
jgi:hypothetical protein